MSRPYTIHGQGPMDTCNLPDQMMTSKNGQYAAREGNKRTTREGGGGPSVASMTLTTQQEFLRRPSHVLLIQPSCNGSCRSDGAPNFSPQICTWGTNCYPLVIRYYSLLPPLFQTNASWQHARNGCLALCESCASTFPSPCRYSEGSVFDPNQDALLHLDPLHAVACMLRTTAAAWGVFGGLNIVPLLVRVA